MRLLAVRLLPRQPPIYADESFVGGASAWPSVCPTHMSRSEPGDRWLDSSAGLTLSKHLREAGAWTAAGGKPSLWQPQDVP